MLNCVLRIPAEALSPETSRSLSDAADAFASALDPGTVAPSDSRSSELPRTLMQAAHHRRRADGNGRSV